jgi:hypothetical protein
MKMTMSTKKRKQTWRFRISKRMERAIKKKGREECRVDRQEEITG